MIELATKRRRVQAAAALGLLSGLLTTLIFMVSESGNDLPVINLLAPGTIFGCILGVWLYRLGRARLGQVFAFALLVEGAWLAARFYATHAGNNWEGFWGSLVGIGIAAGAIGGAGVAVALALPFHFGRRPVLAAVIVAVGAAAGALLAVDFGPVILAPLFYVWQTAIAACLGYAVASSEAVNE